MLPIARDTTVSAHSHRASTQTPGGLRASGYLGRHPIIGLLMLLVGLALFGTMVVDLQTHGPLLQTDMQIVTQLHQFAMQCSPPVRTILSSGFYLGEHVILAMGGVLALYFFFKHYWPELWMVLIAWFGEGGIWLVLTEYFKRPRPSIPANFWTQAPGTSFPSGHTFSAVLCYGLLAYLLVPRIVSGFGKFIVILGTVLLILFIGYSRVYVGDHYPTDVLAGYGLGIAWSGLVYTVIELVSNRRKLKT